MRVVVCAYEYVCDICIEGVVRTVCVRLHLSTVVRNRGKRPDITDETNVATNALVVSARVVREYVRVRVCTWRVRSGRQVNVPFTLACEHCVKTRGKTLCSYRMWQTR